MTSSLRPKKPLVVGVTTAASLAASLGGVLFGLGAFTFEYAEGFSYISSDPEACANCHIMRPQFESWQRASHQSLAGCVECHLPQRGLAKWIAKADNGYRHSRAFTLQDFHEPIVMTAENRRTLQENCMECHRELTHQMGSGAPESVECVHCHRDVGHGERVGLGGPERNSSFQSSGVDS